MARLTGIDKNAGRSIPSHRRWVHALAVQVQVRAQKQGQARERFLLQLSPTAFFRGQGFQTPRDKKNTSSTAKSSHGKDSLSSSQANSNGFLPQPRAPTANTQTALLYQGRIRRLSFAAKSSNDKTRTALFYR